MALQHTQQAAAAPKVVHLQPYWDTDQQTWVIDDPLLGLGQEPLVDGFPEFLDRLVHEIPDADSGFRIELSDHAFPGFVCHLARQDDEYGGYWYASDDPSVKGWFGPALERYFKVPPAELFLRVQPLGQATPDASMREDAAMRTVQTPDAPVVHEPDADDLWASQLLYGEAKALLEAGEHDLALMKLDQALAHNPYYVLALTAREELCGNTSEHAG